jgi:hypothetical protein
MGIASNRRDIRNARNPNESLQSVPGIYAASYERVGDLRRFHGVERTCADVAVNDPERAERERSETSAPGMRPGVASYCDRAHR